VAKYEFTAGYARYYPQTGLYVNPGEVYDLPSAPDADWKAVDGSQTAATPAPAPESTDAPDESVKAAEALLEANPELAQKLVKEAADNA
jgi:hypothetical protein